MLDWAIWGNPAYTVITIVLWAAILGGFVKFIIAPFIAKDEDGRYNFVPATSYVKIYIKLVVFAIAVALMGFWSTTFWATVVPHTTPDFGPKTNNAVQIDPLSRFTPTPLFVIEDEVEERTDRNAEDNSNTKSNFLDLAHE